MENSKQRFGVVRVLDVHSEDLLGHFVHEGQGMRILWAENSADKALAAETFKFETSYSFTAMNFWQGMDEWVFEFDFVALSGEPPSWSWWGEGGIPVSRLRPHPSTNLRKVFNLEQANSKPAWNGEPFIFSYVPDGDLNTGSPKVTIAGVPVRPELSSACIGFDLALPVEAIVESLEAENEGAYWDGMSAIGQPGQMENWEVEHRQLVIFPSSKSPDIACDLVYRSGRNNWFRANGSWHLHPTRIRPRNSLEIRVQPEFSMDVLELFDGGKRKIQTYKLFEGRTPRERHPQ